MYSATFFVRFFLSGMIRNTLSGRKSKAKINKLSPSIKTKYRPNGPSTLIRSLEQNKRNVHTYISKYFPNNKVSKPGETKQN